MDYIKVGVGVIVRDNNKILLGHRCKDKEDTGGIIGRDTWSLPGGKQEYDETIQVAVIREVKEETNLDITEDNLELVGIIAGGTRRKEYPNGDVVINNTALYCVKNYTGEVKWDSESKDMRFFDLDNLPENQHDPDLVEAYIKYINK